MEDRSKKGLLFLLGVAIGATAGYYLNSDEGREVRRQAGQRVNEFGREVETRARGQIDQFSSNVNEAMERGKNYAGDISSTLKSRVDTIASNSGKAFNSNIEKAKRKIKKRIRKLEEAIESEMG